MPRLLPSRKWMADVKLSTGQRMRKVFNTEAEARQYESDPAAQTVAPTVSSMFRHGYEYKWRGTKNSRNQYIHTEELIRLLGEGTNPITITTARIQDLVTTLRAGGNSNSTINRKMVTLRNLLQHCIDRGVTMVMPKVPHFKEGEGRTRFLTEREADRMLAELPPSYRMFAKFLLYTGCRIGEAQALRWSDVSDERITLRWSTTKGARTRTLPLVGDAFFAIRWARNAYANEAGPWVAINYDGFSSAWDRARKAVSLDGDPEVVPHILRHTCASWMVQRGVGIEVVQKWLGHASITITMRYAHLAPNALDAAGLTLASHADTCPHPLPNAVPDCHQLGNGSGSVVGQTDVRPRTYLGLGECPERQRGRTVNPREDQGNQ